MFQTIDIAIGGPLPGGMPTPVDGDHAAESLGQSFDLQQCAMRAHDRRRDWRDAGGRTAPHQPADDSVRQKDHQGDHAGTVQVLVNWWTAGIIGCELMARSKKANPGSFEIYTGVGMACVFELEVVAFERDAWIRHALKGGGRIQDYLDDHLADGFH
jgi:hypothetical protein